MSIDREMQEILKVFFEESREGLDAMESGLLALDAGSDREAINTVFRAAHSIKGGAATFGFMEISRFTHSVETLLDEMRTGARVVGAEAVQLLLQSVDILRGMTAAAEAGQAIPLADAALLEAQLLRLLAGGDGGAAPAPAAAPAAVVARQAVGQGLRIDFEPDASLFLTCNDPLRIFRELEGLGPLAVAVRDDGLPALSEMDPTLCYLAWSLQVGPPAAESDVRELFEWVDANSTLRYEPLGVTAAPARPATPPAQSAAAPKQPGDAASIRVATEKVDALINLVGELVITNSMLSRFGEPGVAMDREALQRGLATLSRNTRELQESVLKIRMLPISFSFNRFPRLVHELSRTLGKKVELKLVGEQTELDKIVLEKIADPLVHLVRNSLDHGIELPGQRLAAGKSETGHLQLNAFHEGGNIIIEVSDDGAGLDRERIFAKALERGLVEPGARLTDEQICNLIFVAGFSTAETLSDVSGRGVGMDVVRRNILDLGGHVQVSSTQGQGSTIRIRLPLTLAILEGQVLRVGREIYVMSLLSIIETVQPQRCQVKTIAGTTEVFRHRDAYLPILRLHEAFGVEPDGLDPCAGLLVVVESDGRRAAILVDELLAQQQVVIKSLDANFRPVPGIAGATIHGDGSVALILDVPGLIARQVADTGSHASRAA
jgi:two-component system chemotaxis sensor kinase CheA